MAERSRTRKGMSMQSIGTGISNLLATFDSDAAKMLRVAQNNMRFKEAVQSTWSDNPDVADFLLAHTNSLYFKKDEALRKGPDKDEDRFVIGVYLDDSTARAELNARREWLRLALAQGGNRIDDLLIHPATGNMKERHLYPDSVARIAAYFGETPPQEQALARSSADEVDRLGLDQSNLLEIVKRAFCLAFGDLDSAWAVLDKVEGAALRETAFSTRATRGFRRYDCFLYVDEAHRETMQLWIDRYGETVITRAKPLGLFLREILVRPSFESIRGRHAFPRTGHPEPLKGLDLRELRSESARVADEVRRKVNAKR